MEGQKVKKGDYIAVGLGYFEKVVSVDPRNIPVTAGERVDEVAYREIMQREEEARKKAEARANRGEESKSPTVLGSAAVGNLIKV